MRGRLGLFMKPSIIGSTTTTAIGRTSNVISSSSSALYSSSSSSGGDGRGRGATIDSPLYNFVAGKSDSNDGFDDSNDEQSQSVGRGHGRGKPLPSSPFLPSFKSFVAADQPPPPQQQPGLGRGRGGVVQHSSDGVVQHSSDDGGVDSQSQPKKPIFLKKDESSGATTEAEFVASEPRLTVGEKNLPESILTVLTGTGRGKPESKKPVIDDRVKKEENRHLRPRQQVGAPADGPVRGGDRVEKRGASAGAGAGASSSPRPKINREEAARKAVGILARGDEGREGGQSKRGGGRRRRDGKSKDDSDDSDEDEDDENALFMGDDADGEKLAKGVGPTVMAELTEAFEEMSSEVLPDPEEDEYLEAYDTNLKIELEPEYLIGDFETNPDINETPPISLPEALEKMKPFLMAYEGIESQEEWEEVMKDTMERVPLLKEIVDHYCGPDKVTAKQQHEELERVAKTIPASVPNSVKRFTDRAVLSLQSNPGWGFDRKCQFMDKLALEVSKSYK